MDDQRNTEKFLGVLEVCIHQARDIHNICIYQNQDVYAKFFLTDNPEKKISSQVINGGGRNPVFNETVRLGVRTLESLLRCEVWMLSRIKNYLEDQLLGFVLVPLSGVSENGKPAQEFELSSSELFHSPAGFVELSFKYTGTSSEVMEVPVPCHSSVANVAEQDLNDPDNVSCELDRIEFPDQKVVNENEKMVSEYLNFSCNQLDSQVAGGCCSLENDNNLSNNTDVHLVKKADTEDKGENIVPTTVVSPSIGSTPSALNPISSESVCDTCVSKSLQLGDVSLHKDSGGEEGGGVSAAAPGSSIAQPRIKVSIEEPEQKVVREEIVDMYMKGMQQFTDALAKMKLPMDHIADGSSSEKDNSKAKECGSDGKADASSKSPDPSPRVFYGSRAFF